MDLTWTIRLRVSISFFASGRNDPRFYHFHFLFFFAQNTNHRNWRHWDSIWWKLVWCTWAIQKELCNSNMIHRSRCVAYGLIPFMEICWKSMPMEIFWFACMDLIFWSSKYSVGSNVFFFFSFVNNSRPMIVHRCMKYIQINSCNWTNLVYMC